MFIYCGSPLISVSVSYKTGLRGSLNITAPMIITGGDEIMSSLSMTGSINIPAVHGLSAELIIYALFSEVFTGKTEVACPLSAMDENTAVTIINGALTISESAEIKCGLTEYLTGNIDIINTLGSYGFKGMSEIQTPIGRTDLTGSLDIRLPQTTAHIIKDELAVYAEGNDVTKMLRKAELKLFGDNSMMAAEAVFKPFAEIPKELTFKINDESYNFITSAYEQSNTECTISAYAPSPALKISAKTSRASELCAENTNIIFSASDFITDAIDEEITEHQLAVTLAEMCGGKARQMKDGRSMIFDTSVTTATYEPDHILSWIKTSPDKFKGTIEVIYGKNGDDYITLEPSSKKAFKGVSLKVYGRSGLHVKAEGGLLKLISRGNNELVSENIIFENGKSRLSKPCTEMISEGITADGKKVYADASCISASVKYKTTYDLYTVTAKSDNATICAYLENRILIVRGTEESESYTAEKIFDLATAYRLAKSKLAAKGGRLTLITTHSNILNTTSAIKAKTPYGTGEVISASVNISTNPLKITDRLEVQTWQR